MNTGDKVTWLHQPRGGYGYIVPVDAVILAIKGDRAKIEVTKVNGEKVTRWVSMDRLQERQG